MNPATEPDPTHLSSWATDELVRVGPLTIRIVSDVSGFPALSYFSRSARSAVPPGGPATMPDAEVWCVSTSPFPEDWAPDQTTRARGFLKGYYVTDHAGPPVRLVTSGRRMFLFGPRLERIVWSYAVKWLLAQHAATQGGLFLKAAAVAVEGEGVLIVGRGGGGKTVMVSELCRQGARFITNSHAVVTGTTVQGVASSMRMRPGPWVDRLGVRSVPALEPAEVVVDPADVFGPLSCEPVQLRHIAVVDYRGPQEHDVRPLPAPMAVSILEQFGLGLNVYRLEEDLLDSLDGDYEAFASRHAAMQSMLQTMVDACRCHHIVTDVTEPSHRAALLQLWCGS